MITEEPFRVGLVAKIAGVSVNVINTWVKRGVLVLESPGAFTRANLFRACACAAVRRILIPPTQARAVLSAVEEELEICFEKGPRAARGYVIAEGLEVPDAHVTGIEEDPALNAHRATWGDVRDIVQEPSEGRMIDADAYALIDTRKIWRRCEPELRRLGTSSEASK